MSEKTASMRFVFEKTKTIISKVIIMLRGMK